MLKKKPSTHIYKSKVACYGFTCGCYPKILCVGSFVPNVGVGCGVKPLGETWLEDLRSSEDTYVKLILVTVNLNPIYQDITIPVICIQNYSPGILPSRKPSLKYGLD